MKRAANGVLLALSLALPGCKAKPEARVEAPPPAAKAAAPADGLAQARARYRERFLDPAAQVALAEALFGAGRLNDSFYVREEARRLLPPAAYGQAHGLLVVGKGRGGWGEGAFDASAANEAALAARLKADPGDHGALVYLAHINAARGDAADAVSLADAALLVDPEDVQMLGFKAQLLLGSDQAGAQALFEKAALLEPDSPDGLAAVEALEWLGSRHGQPGAQALADNSLAALHTAFKRHPRSPAVFMALCKVLVARGEKRLMRELVDRTLAEMPEHPGAQAMAGALEIEAKRPSRAAERFRKALKGDPENLFALEKLSSLLLRELQSPDEALPHLIALHRLDFAAQAALARRVTALLDRRRAAAVPPQADAEALGALLRSEDGAVRAEACLAAAKLSGADLLEAVAAGLDDDVGNVTQNCDYALSQRSKKSPAVVLEAGDRWLASEKPFVRGMVLGVLIDVDPGRFRGAVLRALEDPNQYVRFRGVMAVRRAYSKDEVLAAAAAAVVSGDPDIAGVLGGRAL